MSQLTSEMKRAGTLRRQPATTSTRAVYHQHAPRVKYYRQIFSGRRDRRSAQPSTPARRQVSTPDAVALGLLVLGLQDCTLPPRIERRAWRLAQRWLSQLVEARLARGAA